MISSGIFCRELIGRSSELAFLVDRVRMTAGRPSAAVVVRGEAGIGKTRLVDEVARAAREDGYRSATGSTREYANAPYAALEEALEQLGIDVAQPAEDGAADAKTRRFNAIAESIAAAAASETCGLLIAVEDLHWADVGTLELLRFLATRLAGHAVTFVVTYRPDEIESDSARARSIVALEREADAVVTLDALPAPQIERLLESVIRDGARSVSADVVTQIRDLSDGRPLFAEELLRGVLERLDRDGGAEPSVPTSVRVTVRERFASLTDADRTVLLHAALIGRRFSARFVASFSGHDLSGVYAALRRARDLQLVVEQPDDEGDAFAFRHALTREAVYSELLRAEARLMHGKVAQALAAEPVPDVTAIADHWWRAGDTAAAATWSERAGDDAYAVYAYADAARAYERAHRLAVDDARRAHLAERTGQSWYALGDLTHSVEWFGRAADAYHAAHQPHPAWRLALRKARVLFESGRYEAGLREADGLATTADVEPALRFEAEVMVAGLLTAHGRAAEALERLERAEQLGAHPDPFLSARFSGTYAMALGFVGRPDEARTRFETAVGEARAIGDNDMMLRTYNNWGNLEIAYGTLARARELYAEALRRGDDEQPAHRRLDLAERGAARRAVGRLRPGPAICSRAARGSSTASTSCTAGRSRCRCASERSKARPTQASSTAPGRRSTRRSTTSTCPRSRCWPPRSRTGWRPSTASRKRPRWSAASCPIFEQVRGAVLAGRRRLAVRRRRAARARPRADRRDRGAPGRPRRAGRARADRRPRRAAAPPPRRLHRARGARGGRVSRRGLDARRSLRARAGRPRGRRGRASSAASARRPRSAATPRPGSPAARRRGESTLTGREREIAGLLVAGHATRAIAETLVISERTVETHIAAIYRKLGVSNRRALETLLTESAAT